MAHTLRNINTGCLKNETIDTDDPDIDATKRRDVNGKAIPHPPNGVPVLFHKVKNHKSILSLVVSNARIFAGTQGGQLLVFPGSMHTGMAPTYECAQVWSLETYELLSSIPAHRGAVLSLFVSQDGRLLFSSAGDAIVNVRLSLQPLVLLANDIQVWCTHSLRRLYHIWSTYDVGDVFCVTFSLNLQTVYLGAQNTSIQVRSPNLSP